MRSEQLESLAAALAEAQAEFPAIAKDANNPFFKSKYADLSSVVQTASPILTKHGLSISQFIGISDGGQDVLTTYLLHKSGQFIADTMKLHLGKQDAQGQGSATTYARRYSYMAVLGLVADEDDDGNAASGKTQPKSTPPKSTTKAPEPPARNVADDELVTDAQLKNVIGLLDKKGIADSSDKGVLLKRFAKANYGAESVKDITQKQYKELYVTIQDMDSDALLQLTEDK